MGSVTCERCGFVSFATSEVCKQCGGALPGPAAFNWRPPQPQPQPQPNWQPQGEPNWQQQQQHAYAGNNNWQQPPPSQGWPPPPPHGNSGYHNPGYQQPGYYADDDGLPKRKGMARLALFCGIMALPVMILGIVAAIPLGAPAAILGAVVGIVMTFTALVCGIVGTMRVSKNPSEYAGKGMAVAGIVLGGLLLCSTLPIGVISAIAIPNLLASRRAANEAAAIGALRTITSAQATYLSTAGGGTNYGSMDDLVRNGLVDPKLENTYCRYRFEIETDGPSYVATATPVEYPSAAVRSFYVAEDGVIRGADKGGEAADEDDPSLQ